MKSADKWRRSIFSKILIGYVMLTVLIVILTVLVSFVLVRENSLQSNMTALQERANTIADMMSRPGGSVWLMTSTRREEVLALAEANMAVLYPDMQVRQYTPSVWPDSAEGGSSASMLDVGTSLDVGLLKRLLAGEHLTDIRKFDFIREDVVFAGAPVLRADNTVQCAILLYRPLRHVSDMAYQLAWLHSAAGGAALLISFVLAYIIGRMFSNPMVEMSHTAARIAAGNYGEQVAIRTSDEVGELGTQLNTLSTKLAAVIRNLDEEKTKLAQLIESIGDGVVAVEPNGTIVHRNRAALALLNMGAWEGPGAERRLQLERHLVECMQTRSRTELTLDVAGRTIAAVCAPILSDDGSVYGAVCLLHDVSAMQRLEQMRQDYIANISHELRTPLTGIRGMVEPLMDGYIDTEAEKQNCYHIIYQETRRLERLIGEMLDLSRLQEKRIQLELEPMDAAALARAAMQRIEPRAHDGGIELVQSGEENLMVMGNEDRIIQVLIILLDNAISFTAPGGRITVTAARTDAGLVAISVTDTGAGIAAEDLPYIWERFYKADRSRLRTKGVGLGLSIAKLIVELMGGSIEVQSKLGEGTKFMFTLHPEEARQSY